MPVKSTTPKPATKPSVRRKKAAPAAVAHEQVATRAYFLHLEGGHDDVENWLRAERELAALA